MWYVHANPKQNPVDSSTNNRINLLNESEANALPHFSLTSDESNSRSIFFVAIIVGCENSVAIFHDRFMSCPIKLHLLLPRNTPSGFNIGTILNTKFSRKIVAIGCEPSKNSKNPWQTNDVTDSPGCALANTTITRIKLFVSFFDGFGT